MESTTKIPIIDISATSDKEQGKVAKELVEAAIEHGFVYIRNRGADIPAEAVDEAFDLVRSQASHSVTMLNSRAKSWGHKR